MRWLRRLLGLDATPRTQARRTRATEHISREQQRINGWIRLGWRDIWVPTRRNPKRRQWLWARGTEDGLVELLPGLQGPPVKGTAGFFYVNDNRVYRSDGHPDGPSSIPYYVIRAGKMYPSEGYPSGAAEVAHFWLRSLRAKDIATRVRVNPEFGKRWASLGPD